jgi:phosphate transport system ATP-binding protein
MSPDEMLLDPPHETMSESDERRPDKPRIAPAPEPVSLAAAESAQRESPVEPSAVPPVRTIVVARAPEPVLPPQRRDALRAASSTGPERLRLEDLSIDYGTKKAVKSVSLSIHQGEVLALIGPSGCGKTTLLRTLNRLTELTPSASRAGSVLLDGEDIHEMADTTLREQSRKRPRRRELEPLVVDALRRAGLYDEVRDDLDRPALRLSGGQQQRLCIARAIAPRPEVLLMDEPCSALDPISTATIERLIGELRRDLAVVVVTHNLAQAHRVADKVAFMYLGDLVEYGSTSDVFDQPRATRTRDYVRGAIG